MKYYLCKFVPPRADFLPTLTPDERELMEEHGKFLDALLARDVIVAHGPVLDDAGGYGLSLYQVGDDQDIEALTSQDPIVKGGVGHYEHYSMLHIRSRA